jgi:hypothetical protein
VALNKTQLNDYIYVQDQHINKLEVLL